MIRIQELKAGDFVLAEYEGQQRMGEVTRVDGDQKQVAVETDVQEFWYEPQHLYPIPLSDESLRSLNFEKEEKEDGSVKYKKGSFRLLIAKKDDFSAIEIWYREDKRYQPNVHYIHQLQNHYLQMTKIHLTRDVMV
ncbi:hypothetical protein [Deminuibacter soli]|uniref:Uncharacterized protein n=1 Tax=Deminuibacter soli TaxID=2291815 RepID=A0A3E1NIL5_9BACT|nr:hypothetical protein [Deminuibacter soli]RFM27721.1 hypothetical protein DXN05_13535 [Deminuibacter soli]